MATGNTCVGMVTVEKDWGIIAANLLLNIMIYSNVLEEEGSTTIPNTTDMEKHLSA